MQKLRFLIAFLHLFCVSLFGQQYKATIKQYTEKDGLSSNEVLAITKDKRDVIWVATKYGLNRFDGKIFKVFTTQNGLHNNQIDQLYNDSRHLWLIYKATTAEGSYVKYVEILDIQTYKIISFEAYFGHSIAFKCQQIKYCKPTGENLLLELTNRQYFLYKINGTFEEKKYLPQDEQVLCLTKNGDYWLTKTYGDSTYLLKRDKMGVQIGRSFVFASLLIRFDCETNDETCHFSINLPKEKLFRVQIPKNAQNYEIFKVNTSDSWFANTMYIPNLNLLWYSLDSILAACTPDKQNVLYDSKSVKLVTLYFRQTFIENNTIWLCSHAGFYRVELAKNNFYHVLPNLQFRSILKVKNNFYANSNNNIFIFNDKKYYSKIPIEGLSSTLSADGSFWTGNSLQLFRYYPNTNAPKKYQIPFKDPWAMQEDADGKLWISQNGIIRLDPQTRQIDSAIYNDYKELSQNTIYYFFPFQKTHWYLCATSGLYEFDPTTKQILARHSASSPNAHYLPASDFRHLYYDKKENIFWLASAQKGLIRWNPTTNESKIFSFYSIITNLIHAVYADEFGFLWLSTEGGIIQFHQQTHQFKIYTTKDGLPTNEFNRISHFQDTDGTLYFGSINGIVSFHPKDFQSLFYLKEKGTPFVVEVAQYLGKTNQLENVTRDFERQKRIYLQPNDRFFTLTMGVKEYEQADAARYFYQLKGDAEEWTEAKSNQITLGRLPYGNQILLVKILLANGQFSETVAEIPLYVARPFYLRWWFILLLIALTILFVFWRINILSKRNIQLEAEVARRTEKIQEDKIIIERQASELRQLDELKSRFFANISHELRTPITLIMNPLNHLLAYGKWERDKEKLISTAYKNSQKLLRLVNEILDLTKLEAATLSVELNEIEVTSFIKRIAAEFESLAARKGIVINFDYAFQEKIMVAIDVKKVETILYNFISNAIKFTNQNGNIKIKIFIQNADLQIEVQDTGRGIQTADLPYIFDRFYQSKTNGTSEGGSGLGLALSRELAQLLRGAVWATSEWGKGSTFFLHLPNVVLEKIVITNEKSINIQNLEKEEISLNEFTEKWTDETPSRTDIYKILLVEDNPNLQDYISEILNVNYAVVTKNDGQDALSYLENLEKMQDLPDLIISDVMMPRMDGYQLLNALKANEKYQKIPVIMLTARAGLEDRLKALRIGVDDYMTKPFIEIELLTRIESLLKNANLRKQVLAEATTTEIETASESVILPSEWLKNVEQMIYENMTKPDFSIETMSEILGISRQTFTAHIKKEVGVSAMQYLQEVRLQYARNLLEKRTVNSVKGAAEQVGIADVKYFSRLFKSRFGRLPSEYLM